MNAHHRISRYLQKAFLIHLFIIIGLTVKALLLKVHSYLAQDETFLTLRILKSGPFSFSEGEGLARGLGLDSCELLQEKGWVENRWLLPVMHIHECIYFIVLSPGTSYGSALISFYGHQIEQSEGPLSKFMLL